MRTGSLINEAKWALIERFERFPELKPKSKRVSYDYSNQNMIQSWLRTFLFYKDNYFLLHPAGNSAFINYQLPPTTTNKTKF